MGYEAFDASERFGEREDSHRLGKASDLFNAAADLEAQHRAETALLAPGDSVILVRGKTRIIDGGDL